eukprot:3660482-Rhodomonas_salina.1
MWAVGVSSVAASEWAGDKWAMVVLVLLAWMRRGVCTRGRARSTVRNIWPRIEVPVAVCTGLG